MISAVKALVFSYVSGVSFALAVFEVTDYQWMYGFQSAIFAGLAVFHLKEVLRR